MEYIRNVQKHRPNGAAAEGGRPIGAPPKAAPVFPRYVSDHLISWIFMDIPYIFLIYSIYIS